MPLLFLRSGWITTFRTIGHNTAAGIVMMVVAACFTAVTVATIIMLMKVLFCLYPDFELEILLAFCL